MTGDGVNKDVTCTSSVSRKRRIEVETTVNGRVPYVSYL